MPTKQLDGYFWFEPISAHYHVTVIDGSRREWHAENIRSLRDRARRDGVVLPRNVKTLCLEYQHQTQCKQ